MGPFCLFFKQSLSLYVGNVLFMSYRRDKYQRIASTEPHPCGPQVAVERTCSLGRESGGALCRFAWPHQNRSHAGSHAQTASDDYCRTGPSNWLGLSPGGPRCGWRSTSVGWKVRGTRQPAVLSQRAAQGSFPAVPDVRRADRYGLQAVQHCLADIRATHPAEEDGSPCLDHPQNARRGCAPARHKEHQAWSMGMGGRQVPLIRGSLGFAAGLL